ncbi:hypothetical protein TWF703_006973 [Orbilia oligospora]|uniref:Uncharacterized protein n=1 Tax=Orbilia oligospora TaxID=2813651 RepID=A0A7C8JQU6_ORBOL|nr:hypothetical protein TWF703_006973 [Orbilia oligospora]
MRVARFAPLTLLFLTPIVDARRGGGGGDGGDTSGGGGGGGGGSSDTTKCLDSRANQQKEIYDGPTFSGYYDGKLTFKYRLTESSSETTQPSNCISADNRYHTFTYDAVMNIGATTANGILDFLFWELRAFAPWDRGYSGNIAPLREVFRLASLGYPDLQITYPNGTVKSHATSREISWTTDTTPVRNSTGNITSVNFSTDFVYTPPSDYGAPATNNWVPLEDVCTIGYQIENSQYDSAVFYPRGRNETASGALLTVWLQPNVSDMSANVTGVGTDTVNFSLSNGRFQNLVGGAQPEWPCYSSGGIIFNDPPAGWEPFIKGRSSFTRESYWNASGDFEVTFQGVLNWKMSESSRTLQPVFTGAGLFFLALASTMTFSI